MRGRSSWRARYADAKRYALDAQEKLVADTHESAHDATVTAAGGGAERGSTGAAIEGAGDEADAATANDAAVFTAAAEQVAAGADDGRTDDVAGVEREAVDTDAAELGAIDGSADAEPGADGRSADGAAADIGGADDAAADFSLAPRC